MSDLLKKQQEIFKEQVDELYFIQKKVEERVKEFTTKQIELLEGTEKHLNEMKQEISTKLRNEANGFEKARREISEDLSWNRFRAIGLYILYIVVLAVSLTNMWVIIQDVTRRPDELYEIYRDTVRGKEVVVEPESIRKKEVKGKEYTFAVVKALP